MHKYMTASPLANEVYATGSVIDLKNMCMEAQTAMPVIGRKDDEYNTLMANGIHIMNNTKKGDMSNTQTFIWRLMVWFIRPTSAFTDDKRGK